MSKFITVTRSDGGRITINLREIATIEEHGGGTILTYRNAERMNEQLDDKLKSIHDQLRAWDAHLTNAWPKRGD